MKRLILLLFIVGATTAKPVADADAQVYAYAPIYSYNANPLTYSTNQFHAQDELGQYSYGYQNVDSAKSEVKTADGIVQGSYSYIDANGLLQTTNYISDALGYRVAATNLPVAPAVPEVTVAAEAESPAAVEATVKTSEPVVEAVAPAAAVEAVPAIQTGPAVTINAAPELNNVVVPYVQYANLPYASAFPFYVAQPAIQQIAAVAPATVQVVEQPQEASQAQIQAAVQQTYTATSADQAVAAIAPATPQEIISVPILTQYHSQDELGNYQFSYSDPNANRIETKTAEAVSGTYNYVDSNGVIQTVNYIADDQGFRAAGSVIPVADGSLPQPVVDTPEVIAARQAHLQIYAEESARPTDEDDNGDDESDDSTDSTPTVVQTVTAAPVATIPIVEAIQVDQQIDTKAQQQFIQPNIILQQPQQYVVAQPQQYVVSQPQQYVVAQPQVYAVSQPVVAQASLIGQPVAVSQPVAATANQFHAQDEFGQYNYGYANEHSFKSEQKTADGVVRGSYSYIDANGIVQRVDYISDALGFRVAATNLPVHDVVEAKAVDQVSITPDVPAEAVPAVEEASLDTTPVPVPEGLETYSIDIRNGLPEELAVPATTAEAQPVQAVQQAPQAYLVHQPQSYAVPYSYNYVQPYTAAAYAPVYNYAGSYGYYSNPTYVGASGAVTHVQHHAQDELGQYNYGYSTADSSKSEIKTADGIVQGSYSYVDANGILQTTNYVSDAWGFRVAATNLPVAVAAPEVAPAATVEAA